jgi:CheY-like chemotaxis protein
VSTAAPDELRAIRRAVRELCDRFPGSYWRSLEPDGYPEELVRALTEDGWLAALIAEKYGGAGLGLTAAGVILDEINASGGNAAACHAQMYTMGTLLRHGSGEQKRRYVRGAGYEPVAAASAEKALSRLAEGPVALVLTDLVMPGMGGLELIETLRQRRPDLPVIAMTAADDDVRGRACESGAVAVLRTPVSTHSLLEAVDEALRTPHVSPAAA